MKIIVTGGAGFIGSHIVDALIKKGHKVLVVDNLSTGQKKNLNTRAMFGRQDITNYSSLLKTFARFRPQAVFHTAAQINLRTSLDKPLLDANVNIIGLLNVLEAARQTGVKKIIFSSTGGAIYGEAPAKNIPTQENFLPNPLSPYGLAKLAGEKYCQFYQRAYGLQYINLRYSNVYGPRQNAKGEAGVIAVFINQLLAGQKPIINGPGRQTRDYVYVDDVVAANLLAVKSKTGGTFNVGTGQETTVNEIYDQIIKTLKLNVSAKHGPAIRGEQRRSCLATKKINKAWGWRAKTDLAAGIAKTVKYFKNEIS